MLPNLGLKMPKGIVEVIEKSLGIAAGVEGTAGATEGCKTWATLQEHGASALLSSSSWGELR